MDTQIDRREINRFAEQESLRRLAPDLLPLSKYIVNEKDFSNELWSIYSYCFEDDNLDKRRFVAVARQIINGAERKNSLENLNNFTTIINKFFTNTSEKKIFANWGIMLDRSTSSNETKIESWKNHWDSINQCLKDFLEDESCKNYWVKLAVIAYLFCSSYEKMSSPYERMSVFVWIKFVLRKYLKIHFAFPLWNRVFSRNINIEILCNNWRLLAQIFYIVLITPNDSTRSHNFFHEQEEALKEYKHLEENIKKYQDRWDNSLIKKYLEENADSLDDLCADLNTTREFLTDVWRKSVMGTAIEGCEQFIAEYENAFLKLMQQDELKIEVFTLLAHLSFGLTSYKEWEGQKNGKLGGRGNKKLQA